MKSVHYFIFRFGFRLSVAFSLKLHLLKKWKLHREVLNTRKLLNQLKNERKHQLLRTNWHHLQEIEDVSDWRRSLGIWKRTNEKKDEAAATRSN